MIQQIHSLPDYESLTPGQIHAALSESVLRFESFYSFNTLTIALGNNVMLVEQMVGVMREMGLNASADSLTNRGIDFGIQSAQDLIDVLAANAPEIFTTEIAATLKSLGQQTRWASLGGVGEVPDVQAITDALAAYAASQREAARVAALNNAVDAVRGSVDLASESISLADVQDAISDALAAGWGE